ncbi:uncharacterized protein LMH87_008487 [Akanthomyces muscarius]|uniref:Uncharacterized protein n=1 Tax=Akanthomyces muscarius TaxID=2231603 RepID=A0A9W8QGF4_AKAMU|nr:uncharacterized protein LMH87_008487 [Akanthomyces muscarius]KAJ4157934.1 hypothetical protein LMH87_008487 [Akanthomyces muscarius]
MDPLSTAPASITSLSFERTPNLAFISAPVTMGVFIYYEWTQSDYDGFSCAENYGTSYSNLFFADCDGRGNLYCMSLVLVKVLCLTEASSSLDIFTFIANSCNYVLSST